MRTIAATLVALVLVSGALAKGPSEATISGPGLAKPLELGGPNGWAEGSPMAELTTRAGFFQVAWGGQPGRTLAKSPTEQLGPRYRVVYVVPGPSGRDDRIRQDLYPFARGGAVTYTPPGQRFFDTRRTAGGWFRVAGPLTPKLVEAGLPRPSVPAEQTGGADADSMPTWPIALILPALGLGVFVLRRRFRPAPA